MKLGKSKLALARVINESGGWVDDSANWAVQPKHEEGDIWFSSSDNKPYRNEGLDGFTFDGSGLWLYDVIKHNKLHQNWHQCVLSREEYHQAYPKDDDGWIEWKGGECPVKNGVYVDTKCSDGDFVTSREFGNQYHLDIHNDAANIIAYRPRKPEVKPEFCESVMRSIPEPEEKPTIEQLAQDYRNKLDLSNRKQQEADDAKAAADAALGELERAGEALGLLIGIAKPDPDPELVITDWRDLQVGDEIECVGYGHPHTIGVVERFDEISVDQNIFVRHQNGDVSWPRLWNFIRRP